MRKLLSMAMILVMAMVAPLLVGCGSDSGSSDNFISYPNSQTKEYEKIKFIQIMSLGDARASDEDFKEPKTKIDEIPIDKLDILINKMGIFMIINFDWTFVQFHHILFPKPESFRDAFFGTVSYYEEEPYINNLLLIEVLSIEVFMDAAWIILSITLLTLALWLSVSFKKKRINKINEFKADEK